MIDRACISINAKCNLNCNYCHFGNKINKFVSKEYQFSPDEILLLMNNIFSYVKEKNITKFKLGIVGAGEPLLNFETIQRIVGAIKKIDQANRFKLYTISNGTLLNKERLNYFYENRELIELDISLDGDKSIHETNRQAFDVTFKNILDYEVLFQEKPLINCVVTRVTLENKDKIIKFFKDNHFKRINFSIIFGIDNPDLIITQNEYDAFLEECLRAGIQSRQNKSLTQVYDCTKYGALCGVGKTNIFFTKKGVYPCGRFMGQEDYNVAKYSASLQEIEEKISRFKSTEKNCYYEHNKVGDKK